MEKTREEKATTVFRWLATIALYAISTYGLAAGLGISLSYGVSDINPDAFTISENAAWVIGFLVGLVIQWMETDWILHPWDANPLETRLIKGMIVIDGFMIFLGVGGHLNIIWLVNNFSDIPGLIVHIAGLLGQVLAALLGSLGAELMLQKSLGREMYIPRSNLSEPSRAEEARQRYMKSQESKEN